MACAGCAGCGGCVEPSCPGTCSVNCTGGTCKCSYTLCPWPALSGSGCLPGGNCNSFANQKFCLKNTAADVWKTDIATVDCTTTYGVVVDIRWEMTLDGSGNVSLVLKAYLTGTSTLVATIATYAGTIDLSKCDQLFRVAKVSDGGQCFGWPCTIEVSPQCCGSCPDPPCVDPCCTSTPGVPGPPTAVVHGLSATNTTTCTFGCDGCFDGTDWLLPFLNPGSGQNCQWYLTKSFATCFINCAGSGAGQATVAIGNLNYFIGTFGGVTFTAQTVWLIAYFTAGGVNRPLGVYYCNSFDCHPGATNTFIKFTDGSCIFASSVTQTWTL